MTKKEKIEAFIDKYNGYLITSLVCNEDISKTYVSKYIKDKSGKTFGEHLTAIRLSRAKSLLISGNDTIENISYSVGYPNVEHFIRTFKKHFNMTPMQYRKDKN